MPASSKTEPSIPDAEAAESDVVVRAQFLAFLEKDMADNPQRLEPIDRDLQQRVHDLVGHIDLGETLEQKLAGYDRPLHDGEIMGGASIGLERF